MGARRQRLLLRGPGKLGSFTLEEHPMKWKSPRCGQACWDEIRLHDERSRALVVKLTEVTADRDEWRTQHENLLAMYRAEVAKNAAPPRL